MRKKVVKLQQKVASLRENVLLYKNKVRTSRVLMQKWITHLAFSFPLKLRLYSQFQCQFPVYSEKSATLSSNSPIILFYFWAMGLMLRRGSGLNQNDQKPHRSHQSSSDSYFIGPSSKHVSGRGSRKTPRQCRARRGSGFRVQGSGPCGDRGESQCTEHTQRHYRHCDRGNPLREATGGGEGRQEGNLCVSRNALKMTFEKTPDTRFDLSTFSIILWNTVTGVRFWKCDAGASLPSAAEKHAGKVVRSSPSLLPPRE